MDDDRLYDLVLIMIGFGAVAWSVGLSVVLIALDSRRKTFALNLVMAGFSRRLANFGGGARKTKNETPAQAT